MVAGRVRAAGAMLAAGLFLLSTGCSGSTATAPPPATVMTATPATAGVTAAGFPADFVGDSWSVGTMDVVAVYSATDGHLIRKLTVPAPGGGPGGPLLSPDGRLGSCLGGETISLAPADPSAMLAETYDACLSPTARGDYRIVNIRAGQAWRVTSGEDLPQAASW